MINTNNSIEELFPDIPFQGKIKRKYGPRKKKKEAINHASLIEQLDLMLDCLNTPDAILDVPEQWTDADIEYLREHMIMSQLKIIVDKRGGKVARQEAWEWVLSDEILPFSFRVCLSTLAINYGFVELIDENISLDQGLTEEDIMLSIDVDYLRSIFYHMAKRSGVEINFCLLV